jgi:hypothetical protein
VRAPEAYITWTNSHLGFNPRSQANSNALSDFVVLDLRESCLQIDAAIASGKLRVVRNATVNTKVAGRSIDLVLDEGPMVSISVEHKSIMTAHGKARWNRYGDLIAYCNHMHNHCPQCIAGAIVIVNTSPAPRRSAKVTHFCSVRVTHTKNTIWNAIWRGANCGPAVSSTP